MITNLIFCQEIEYNIKEKKLDYFLDFEEELNSDKISNSSKFGEGSNLVKSIQFLRKEKIIPDLVVEYFFYQEDSIIAGIVYEWDIYNLDKSSNNQQSFEFQKQMIKKYNSLDRELSIIFGEAVEITGDLEDFTQINELTGLHKRKIWKPYSGFEIEVDITISNYYSEYGTTEINPIHRISLSISNNERNEKFFLTLDKVTKEFIDNLNNKKFRVAKKLLSQQIKAKITKRQLKEMAKLINGKGKIEVLHKGTMNTEENVFICYFITYKYSSDKSNSYREILSVKFDTEDKILAFQGGTFRVEF
jgi:hypothetical protein